MTPAVASPIPPATPPIVNGRAAPPATEPFGNFAHLMNAAVRSLDHSPRDRVAPDTAERAERAREDDEKKRDAAKKKDDAARRSPAWLSARRSPSPRAEPM
jgi:hypothetical protein